MSVEYGFKCVWNSCCSNGGRLFSGSAVHKKAEPWPFITDHRFVLRNSISHLVWHKVIQQMSSSQSDFGCHLFEYGTNRKSLFVHLNVLYFCVMMLLCIVRKCASCCIILPVSIVVHSNIVVVEWCGVFLQMEVHFINVNAILALSWLGVLHSCNYFYILYWQFNK